MERGMGGEVPHAALYSARRTCGQPVHRPSLFFHRSSFFVFFVSSWFKSYTPGGGMKIREMRVVPVAMADPPLRSAFGLHAPYALRTIVQLTTDDGITG